MINKAHRGFSLVEILVAMVITAVSLAGSFSLFARTTQLHQQGVAHMRANRLAVSVADALAASGALVQATQAHCSNGDAAACQVMSRRHYLLQEATQYARHALPHGTVSLQTSAQDTWLIQVQWQPPLSVQPSRRRLRVDAQ